MSLCSLQHLCMKKNQNCHTTSKVIETESKLCLIVDRNWLVADAGRHWLFNTNKESLVEKDAQSQSPIHRAYVNKQLTLKDLKVCCDTYEGFLQPQMLTPGVSGGWNGVYANKARTTDAQSNFGVWETMKNNQEFTRLKSEKSNRWQNSVIFENFKLWLSDLINSSYFLNSAKMLYIFQTVMSTSSIDIYFCI